MWLYKDVEVSLQYIGEEDTRVLTIDWKIDVKKWDIFKTTEKEAKQLLRMYWYLYQIVSDEQTEEDTTDDTDTSNDTTDETSDDVNNEENTENTEENTEESEENEKMSEEELEKEELRKAYKEKYNQEVPVNKKNDINWIKSKL